MTFPQLLPALLVVVLCAVVAWGAGEMRHPLPNRGDTDHE